MKKYKGYIYIAGGFFTSGVVLNHQCGSLMVVKFQICALFLYIFYSLETV
jgi:hypothetical protein